MDLVSKHEALAIPNMYLRTEIEVSATELNSSNDETDLGEKDNEYKDLKKKLDHDVPDIESTSYCSARLIYTTEGTVMCDHCGFISNNIPELKSHEADTHDGL